MYEGKKFEYGSVNEAIAIIAHTRKKNAQFLSAIFSVVDPKQASEVVKKLRFTLFPEEKFDDILYIKKAKGMFEKLRTLDFKINVLK